MSDAVNPVSGPLEGFRIVDLTSMISGPVATMMLADQGASVIKVEPPGLGDIARWIGVRVGGISAMAAMVNRAKRSIAVNLQTEEGREAERDGARCSRVGGENLAVQPLHHGAGKDVEGDIEVGVQEPTPGRGLVVRVQRTKRALLRRVGQRWTKHLLLLSE